MYRPSDPQRVLLDAGGLLPPEKQERCKKTWAERSRASRGRGRRQDTGVADRRALRTRRAERWDKQRQDDGGQRIRRRPPLALPPEFGLNRRKRVR